MAWGEGTGHIFSTWDWVVALMCWIFYRESRQLLQACCNKWHCQYRYLFLCSSVGVGARANYKGTPICYPTKTIYTKICLTCLLFSFSLKQGTENRKRKSNNFRGLLPCWLIRWCNNNKDYYSYEIFKNFWNIWRGFTHSISRSEIFNFIILSSPRAGSILFAIWSCKCVSLSRDLILSAYTYLGHIIFKWC